jgi:EAL domain-containing protein (putative c-di-GMP-specific phosphodiesterase class I)
MYRSKELGRNTFQFLDADLAARRLYQHTLETALRAAVKSESLTLRYQPIVRIADRRVVAAEALLRWSDPALGDIAPRVLVPLAEECGLIDVVGDWVVRHAARQCVAWRRDGRLLVVSVNLSARQFYREDLARRIAGIVREEDCAPEWLQLEVTETSLLHDLDAIRKALHDLRAEGFAVAIDDFGTGYSSLNYLRRFPINSIKLDQTFVRDLDERHATSPIVNAIVGIADGFDLKLLAEGVETDFQRRTLQDLGCDEMQGFLFSRPLPAVEVARLLNA